MPDGYAIVRVDSRGAGRSPGFLDPKSVRETKDLYDCIEWAGVQPWSNGKVGLNGISYFATNQWYVAPLQPPHLAAMCVWEGASDYYRENTHHGGILCTFALTVNDFGVWPIQHGMGERGRRSRATGELVSGPETLSPEELKKNRIDLAKSLLSHPLDDRYYRDRVPDWSKVKVPFLSAANWGGLGLHPRGNFEGFMRAASEQKWLEAHGSTHWAHFYSTYGEALQKRFFAHFLKGEDNGWDRQPRVQLQVRHPGEKFVERHENEWPIARTQWTKFYLDAGRPLRASTSRRTRTDAAVRSDGRRPDFPDAAARARDRDHRAGGRQAVRVFGQQRRRPLPGAASVRAGRQGGRVPGLERSAHAGRPRLAARLASQARSRRAPCPIGPITPHDEVEPLTPGVPVELDVEIWPTCIVVPPGYRIGFSVRGNDYRYDAPPLKVPGLWYEMTGVGPFKHDSPEDRPPEVFGATVTLHFEPGRQPYVLLPIIPPR